MALTADTPRTTHVGDKVFLPVKETTTIYRGAAVGDDGAGFSRGLVAADPFLGFAILQADNSAGAAGDITAEVQAKGYIELSVTGVVQASIGAPVYASDDGTFTLTATSNSLIGWVAAYLADGSAIVEFDSAAVKAALHA